MDNPIPTELAVEFEVANHERHVREQRALAARFHPQHAAQFVSSLAVRQLVHERRVHTIRGTT